MDFSLQDIMNLKSLLTNDESENLQETQFYSGSVLNPSNITNQSTSNSTEKKELAQPFCKIEAKVNNRMVSKPKTTEVWKEDELIEDNLIEDGRPQPQYEILYKQSIHTEDIYLGLSGKDPSSISCDRLLIKISLPNTFLKEIGLEVHQQSLHLQTPSYLLNLTLPYPVDKDSSSAKWDKEKSMLLVELKIIRKDIFDEFVKK